MSVNFDSIESNVVNGLAHRLATEIVGDFPDELLRTIISDTAYQGFSPDEFAKLLVEWIIDLILTKGLAGLMTGMDRAQMVKHCITLLVALSAQQGTKLQTAIDNMPANNVNKEILNKMVKNGLKANTLGQAKNKKLITPSRAAAAFPLITANMLSRKLIEPTVTTDDLPLVYSHANGAALIPMSEEYQALFLAYVSWSMKFNDVINSKKLDKVNMTMEDKAREAERWATIARAGQSVPEQTRIDIANTLSNETGFRVTSSDIRVDKAKEQERKLDISKLAAKKIKKSK